MGEADRFTTPLDTKSESALVDRDNVAGEKGVRAHHPEETVCTGVEAPLVNILDTFEQEGLTHTNVVISCDGKSVHAQLFLLVVDEPDEMVDLSRVDGDGLGDVMGERAETF